MPETAPAEVRIRPRLAKKVRERHPNVQSSDEDSPDRISHHEIRETHENRFE